MERPLRRALRASRILCTKTSGELQAGKDASDAKVFTQLPEAMLPEHKTFLATHWTEIVANA